MRSFWALLLVSISLHAGAQDLAARHALIGKAYEAERYAEVARLIEAQLEQAQGTTWQDSLHQYLYKYGRAMGKTKGADAGIAAAESVLARMGSTYKAADRMDALFDLSWIYYEAGRYKQCVRVDSLATVVAKRPGVPRAMGGRAHQYLAFDYSIIGDHRSSLAQAKAALREYAKADSVAVAQWAESYTAAGVANWHLGFVHEAEEWYNKALETLGDGTTEPILNRKASTYGNLGVLWQQSGDLARSKANYHASLRMFDQLLAATKDPFTRDEATVNRSRTYLNLATVYFAIGDEGRARELLELAWTDRSSVLHPDDPQLLSVRDRMADLELAAGALKKAEVLERAYLTACEQRYGKQSEEYVRAAAKLADILAQQGNRTSADSLFRLSIANGRHVADDATSSILLGTLKKRASMKSGLGLHTEAFDDLRQARDIAARLATQEDNAGVALCDVRMAEQAFLIGRFQQARDLARGAWAMMQDRAQAVLTGNGPTSCAEPGLLPDVVYWTIRAEQAMPVPDSVRKTWKDMIGLAIRSLERNRAGLSDAASKLRLTGSQQRLFALALDLAYEQYARSRSEADLQGFLDLSEANRSILLKEKLNSFAGLRFAGVPDSILVREQELQDAVTIEGGDRASITDLDRHEREYADFLVFLEHTYPKYFALRHGGRTASLADIRKHLLAPDRQLLSYVRAGDHLYALMVGEKAADLVRMDAKDLGRAVDELRAALMKRESAAYVANAHAVYNHVFAPIAEKLPARELFIIPDAELGSVNFEALLSQPGVKDFKEHLLIHRYTISYLLSATTALQFADGAPGRAKGTLAMAPGFTDDVKQAYRTQVKDTAEMDRRFLSFVRQPFAMGTAMALGESEGATVVTGTAATEEAFTRQAGTYGILFLGTHAEMNPKSPMYSRLVLSKDGDGTASGGDGYLHAYEIYALDLKAQLAVITACESGSGKVDPGEGVRSLGASFAYAGCPSLVASLWSIDEKVSAQIMDSFFKHLEQGMPKHQALRQAKLEFLATAQDELALPYYWAGLVLTGDVAPVETRGRWPWWWMLTTLGVLLAGWGVLRVRSRRKREAAGGGAR
ncbi:MAG: CHAT domain-containing protein [Flavobacteriales bacterium]|nr:CHAT domain-containing protein [Flavobacteriales bacterium]